MAEGKAFMLDMNSQRDVEEFSAERESSRLNMASRLGLTRREMEQRKQREERAHGGYMRWGGGGRRGRARLE